MAKYSNKDRKYIRSGRDKSLDGKTEEYKLVNDTYDIYSRHFTIIFNVFVCM